MSVKARSLSSYLRFHLSGGRSLCRLLVRPDAIMESSASSQWQAARLIAPMLHHEAEQLGGSGQAEFLAHVLHEDWWRESLSDHRLLATRTPSGWAREFSLYRESVNPLVTGALMRHAEMAYRSPYIKGLYLTGSATQPGQGVSSCAVSGILSARRLLKDIDASVAKTPLLPDDFEA